METQPHVRTTPERGVQPREGGGRYSQFFVPAPGRWLSRKGYFSARLPAVPDLKKVYLYGYITSYFNVRYSRALGEQMSPGAGGYAGAGAGGSWGLMRFPRLLPPGIIKGGARSTSRRRGGAEEAGDSHDYSVGCQGGRENKADHRSRGALWTGGHGVIPRGRGKGYYPQSQSVCEWFYSPRRLLFHSYVQFYRKNSTITIRTPANTFADVQCSGTFCPNLGKRCALHICKHVFGM
jgi:hypothetical protein